MKELKSAYWLVLAMMIMVTILAISKCNAQSYSFNYRGTQKGNYNFYITNDSLYISESFIYEENNFKKIWKNEWQESIVETYKSQQYTTIETNSAQYLFLYCEDDNTSWQICELVYKPKVGDSLTYQKLLK